MKSAPRGFTLLEAVIVISLLGVVGVSFAYLLTTSQRFLVQSTNAASSQSDASFGIEHIKRHVLTARDVTTPAAGASASQIVFIWQPTAATAERTSRYDLQGTNLRFVPDTSAPGTAEVIAQGIQAITFNRVAAGTISVDITAQRTSGGDTRQMHLQTDISPRGIFQ